MKNKITVTGVNILFFIFVFLFFLFQIVLTALSIFFGEGFIENSVYGILLVNEYVLILIPAVLFVLLNRLGFREVLRFNRLGVIPALLIIPLSIAAYFVANVLNVLVVYALQFIGDVQNQMIPTPKNLPELFVGILIVAVSPAICEEIMHRGLILKAYENRGSVKAVYITAFYFGLFHFDITNFLGPVLLGGLIGYYVLRTNSILAGFLAHFINNTIAELLNYILMDEAGTNVSGSTRITLPELGSYVIYGIIGLLALLLLIRLFNSATEGRAVLKPPVSRIRDDIRSLLSHWPIAIIVFLYILNAVFYILMLASKSSES